jgi:hypothetical protein
LVKKASEYKQHAKQCRLLSSQAVSDDHRERLLAMADTWDTLALEREKTDLSDNGHLAAQAGDPQAGDQRRTTH